MCERFDIRYNKPLFIFQNFSCNKVDRPVVSRNCLSTGIKICRQDKTTCVTEVKCFASKYVGCRTFSYNIAISDL